MSIGVSIRDATIADVRSIDWASSRVQSDAWLRECRRGQREASFMVAVCNGLVVGKVSVDWVRKPGVAWIWMASVCPAWQGHGIGTAMIAAAEVRAIRNRVVFAELAVDDDNPRAAALYERLGYRFVGSHFERRPAVDDHGNEYVAEKNGRVMRKALDTAGTDSPEFPVALMISI
ncbi:GNAT family N-acetyltransferase [Paractinoplanes hotanensis]|uniref:GNAT family N-acetyltransferase n=1 Tax=Paractinoplanes hotanensis TaxID=2906497 RepID=A0ABT0XYB4_9ACTN|nr:GNAT family N-acetyltransferase [Actinoplanes hotanensis]MCM4078717.1 GNAT family N-acetyltransferase [Actinoplanes hotanensis]